MSLIYEKTTIGTITIKQKSEKLGLDRSIVCEIRQGNALAIVIHRRRATEEELKEYPTAKWYHNLVTFFVDEIHLKNLLKNEGTILPLTKWEKVTNIKLNLYYKECGLLLKYFVRSGHKVTCYYEEPKR